jgi:hypothetical protein
VEEREVRGAWYSPVLQSQSMMAYHRISVMIDG